MGAADIWSNNLRLSNFDSRLDNRRTKLHWICCEDLRTLLILLPLIFVRNCYMYMLRLYWFMLDLLRQIHVKYACCIMNKVI